MNLMMLLEMAAQSAPDRLAIGTLEGGLTYGRLYELAGGAATLLRGRAGDRVLYTDVSSPTLPVALFGSSWAGKPFVPVSYRLADDRLRTIVTRQAPATLLHGSGTGPDGGERTAGIDEVEQMATDAFLAAAGAAETAEADWSYDENDIAILLHTSGTSGDPKVAVLRQKHLVSYVFGSVEFLGAGEDEATLVSVPPYHIAGMAAILTATYGGRRLVQLPDFEPHEWVRMARQEHITHAMVVPTMLARILEVLEADGDGLPALRHLAYGGGRMPLPVIEKALELLPNVGFVNAYGLTETSSSITVLGPDDHRVALGSDDPAVRARLGSVGQPLPTVELSIRDPLGVAVPTGQRGEVWVRGEQVSGEYGTSTTTDGEGWFPTKDAGRLDEEGYLYLEGRIDDVIIRGGENLSPGEIEDVLLTHESIRDAVVLGVPDTEWGEVVAAVVVAVPGATIDADEVRAFVTKQLRSSRAPAIVDVRDELPYTDTGKVLRRILKPELVERYAR
jgi:acyl-CoA synthetase (AMP-forming)/AMP-acid ligase II